MITNTYSVSVPTKKPLVDINNNLLRKDDYITILEDDDDRQEFLLDVRSSGIDIEFKPSETYLIYLRQNTSLSYDVLNKFRLLASDQPEDIVLKITIKDDL